MVRQCQNGWASAYSNRSFATFAMTHRQPFLTVKLLALLAGDDRAVTAQQNVQTAIAEPTTLHRQGQ